MELWGSALYGDPCRQCGFDWSVKPANAVALVVRMAEQVRQQVSDAPGDRRRPAGGWSVSEYVSHMADNLRNWAERVQGAILTGERDVAGYHPDELARARRYEAIPLAAAVWSLEVSCQTWGPTMTKALSQGLVLQHATRGRQSAEDIARNNCHDAWHHLWDIQEILAVPPTPMKRVSEPTE